MSKGPSSYTKSDIMLELGYLEYMLSPWRLECAKRSYEKVWISEECRCDYLMNILNYFALFPLVNVTGAGKRSGFCFPPDFGGACDSIPDLCVLGSGSQIEEQCGSPCVESTRNV